MRSHMSKERKLIQFDHYSHRYIAHGRDKAMVTQACRHKLLEQINSLFNCLDIVEPVFTNLAKLARHYEQQKTYLTLLKQYSFEKNTIKKNLKKNILDQYDNFFAHPTAFLKQTTHYTPPTQESDSKSQKDKQQLHKKAADHLVKRFASLQGIPSASLQNPLSSQLCLYFFNQCLSQLPFTHQQIQQIEQQIQPSLIIELTALYQELNQTLIKQEVLTLLSFSDIRFYRVSPVRRHSPFLMPQSAIPNDAKRKTLLISQHFIWPIGSIYLSPHDNAQQAVHALFVRHSPIPVKLLPIIYDGYIPLLSQYFSQNSHDDKLAVLDNISRLIDSLTGKKKLYRENTPSSINNIYKLARQQIKQSPVNSAKLTQLLEILKQCHILAIKDERIENQDLHYYIAKNTTSLESFTSQAESIMTQLSIGQWIRLESRTDAIKLSWHSNLTQRYLFVNQYGEKAGEWSEIELTRLFEQGKAHLTTEPTTSNTVLNLLNTIEGSKSKR